MKHLSEEELVLCYYAERQVFAGAGEHLQTCAACLVRFRELSELLDAVELDPVPDPGEGYPAEVWARIQWRLESPRPRWKDWFSWKPLGVAATVAGLVVAAFLVGRFGPGGPRQQADIPEEVRTRILMAAVASHLDRSQQVLVEFLNAPHNGVVDLSTSRWLAAGLLTENRLYRLTALREGNVALAAALEDLERALLEIRHSPAALSRQEWESCQRAVDVPGMLFKIRVLALRTRTQVQRRGTADARTIL